MIKKFPDRVYFLMIVVVLIAGCTANNNTQNCSVDYWVSTTGNDQSGNGSMDAPFATIDRTRMVVQANGQKGRCRMNVNIQGGVYTLQQPIPIFGHVKIKTFMPQCLQAS